MKRIQLKRTKGWRLPENTVVVSRPTKWGNPFKLDEVGHILYQDFLTKDWILWQNGNGYTLNHILLLYEKYITQKIIDHPAPDITELIGKDLACWCSLDKPCHADILIKVIQNKMNSTNYPSNPIMEDLPLKPVKTKYYPVIIDLNGMLSIEEQLKELDLKYDQKIISQLDLDNLAIRRLHFRTYIKDKKSVKYKLYLSNLLKTHLEENNASDKIIIKTEI